jgi:hypothetical protein
VSDYDDITIGADEEDGRHRPSSRVLDENDPVYPIGADPMELQSDRWAPEPIQKVRKDLREGVVTLSLQEVRFLVDLYYSVQDFRISSANQVRALGLGDEPDNLLEWGVQVFARVEDEIRKGLDLFSRKEPSGLGRWQRSITGIGPVIASGFLAHIDIEQAPTAGHIWSFAGLNPTQVWEPHTKRPWNARLKVLCWKAGESWVKLVNNRNDVYGKIYAARKVLEIERNEAGKLADQAADVLTKKRIGRTTQAYQWYSQGKLPPAHIHARAKRYAVKLYLAHYQETAYFLRYGDLPPIPYPVVHLPGHAHVIVPPNSDLLLGLVGAQKRRRPVS